MPTLATALEMFEELARRGLIVPSSARPDFTMPTAFRTVPTIVTYGTPDLPIQMGTGNAGLERGTKGYRG
jgi:hypothetical protein